jgi:thioester reductase-like protein
MPKGELTNMSDITKRISNLSPEKRRLFELMLEEKGVELPMKSSLGEPMVALNGNGNIPFSEMNESTAGSQNFKDDVFLDDTICPNVSAEHNQTEPHSIFLTGATGFLGNFLLYELLTQTSADVYCLVRGSEPNEAKKRIEQNLVSHSLWDESLSPRIIPVIGDLSENFLSLSEDQFQALERKIDAIYHCGAMVNFSYPYAALRETNVLGTREILRLASQSKIKSVHYISSVAVFSTLDNLNGRKISEDESTGHPGTLLVGGYAESKWVAEKLVETARSRGIPVCIYRPGIMSGHSQTGIFNPNDFLYILSQTCATVGSFPDIDLTIDLTPVDFASKAIVHLSKKRESLGKNYHIVNPNPLITGIIPKLLTNYGIDLKRIPYNQWLNELTKLRRSSAECKVELILPMVTSFLTDGKIKGPHFDCRNTLQGLSGTSIACPRADENLLKTYLTNSIRSGFLSFPRSAEGSE